MASLMVVSLFVLAGIGYWLYERRQKLAVLADKAAVEAGVASVRAARRAGECWKSFKQRVSDRADKR